MEWKICSVAAVTSAKRKIDYVCRGSEGGKGLLAALRIGCGGAFIIEEFLTRDVVNVCVPLFASLKSRHGMWTHSCTRSHAKAEEVEEVDGRIPVTILTGFLGAGKTTLLNYILKEKHGMKIAVIENEFGEIGIDDALVRKRYETEEEIFEMNNGCICCTVRGDLIRILKKILKRKTKIDALMIEVRMCVLD